MFDFIPDAERLSRIFASATAPTFFLGAVAAFAALMTSRTNEILGRIRTLNAIGEADHDRVHLKADLNRLVRRVNLLKQGLQAVLIAGVFATSLLALLFLTEFMGLEYAYGAGLLFVIATVLLCFALFRFAQEAHISVDEADKF
jgi:hypothetical protein